MLMMKNYFKIPLEQTRVERVPFNPELRERKALTFTGLY
jgi:hypothetical protein